VSQIQSDFAEGGPSLRLQFAMPGPKKTTVFVKKIVTNYGKQEKACRQRGRGVKEQVNPGQVL
jgi:hypothetical protein